MIKINSNLIINFFVLPIFLLFISCSTYTIASFENSDGDIYYLEDISDTYFLTSKGMTKHIVENGINKLMKKIITKNDYREFHVLLTGDIGRSIYDIRLTMIARVKFFRTEEEYIKFSQNYNPFG